MVGSDGRCFEAPSQSNPISGTVLAENESMKIAVAYGNGRISPVFDTARELVLIDFEGKQELQRTSVAVSGPDPFDRVRSVRRSGAGVKVCSFIRGELDAVVSAYLAGRLEDARYQMPGKPKPAEEKTEAPQR